MTLVADTVVLLGTRLDDDGTVATFVPPEAAAAVAGAVGGILFPSTFVAG